MPVDWPQYSSNGQQYLIQQQNMTVSQQSPDLLERYTFWNEEFYAMTRRHNVGKRSLLPGNKIIIVLGDMPEEEMIVSQG